MTQHLVIDTESSVVNAVDWDGSSPFSPPVGTQLIEYAGPAYIGGTWNGTRVVPPGGDPQPPPTTVEMIVAERGRRLALGFDYNFGDARGVHRIGTTDADRKGWDEVSDYASALIDSGDTTTTIAIVTDTGPCVVTAPEWSAIKISAAAFRQPLWAKSFILQQTLPADYQNDAHWS